MKMGKGEGVRKKERLNLHDEEKKKKLSEKYMRLFNHSFFFSYLGQLEKTHIGILHRSR